MEIEQTLIFFTQQMDKVCLPGPFATILVTQCFAIQHWVCIHFFTCITLLQHQYRALCCYMFYNIALGVNSLLHMYHIIIAPVQSPVVLHVLQYSIGCEFTSAHQNCTFCLCLGIRFERLGTTSLNQPIRFLKSTLRRIKLLVQYK